MFYDVHALIVIVGGGMAATMIRFPFSGIAHGLPMGLQLRLHRCASIHPRELIEEMTQIAEVVRKNGPMALENVQVGDTFLAQGTRATSPTATTRSSSRTRWSATATSSCIISRRGEGLPLIGDCAPAWGMVGTILGMVQMFANMSDPSKLGPLMAIALLATLYGAVVANLFCLPIADKLHVKLEEENVSRSLIIDGILLIRESKSPSLVQGDADRLPAGAHRAEIPEAA